MSFPTVRRITEEIKGEAMTHPFIEASLKYRKAQAKVLKEAVAYEATGEKSTAKLIEAVREMKEAKETYSIEKNKVMAEPLDWDKRGGPDE